jgi:hypothetical protein
MKQQPLSSRLILPWLLGLILYIKALFRKSQAFNFRYFGFFHAPSVDGVYLDGGAKFFVWGFFLVLGRLRVVFHGVDAVVVGLLVFLL